MSRVFGSTLLLFAAINTVSGQNSLYLVDPSVQSVDQSGSVTFTLTLRNKSAEPAPFQAVLSDFSHKRPGSAPYFLGTTYAITPVTDADKTALNNGLINKALSLKITVARLWEAGESTATLKNGEQDIPTLGGSPASVLRTIRIPAAYNVQIESPGNTTPELVFSRGGNALLKLVNSDSMNYRFGYRLRVGDEVRAPKTPFIDVPANGGVYVDLADVAPRASLLAGGTVKDELSNGELILQPVLDAGIGVPPLPPKILPVNFRLRYWSTGYQQVWNMFWVFILLTAGGVTSIWIHCGMPNTSRALALTRRLGEIEAQLQGIGRDLASRWRVLLHSRVRNIAQEMSSTWWIFPSFSASLDRLTKTTDMVESWVDIAYGVSMVLHRASRSVQDGMPPTILDWIEGKCNAALAHFESGFTTSDEILAMRADLEAAKALLSADETHAPVAELEKEIQQREERLVPLLPAIAESFPEFAGCIDEVRRQAGTALQPVDYLDRDTSTLKVEMLNDFRELMIRAGASSAAAAAAGSVSVSAAGTDSALARLEQHRKRLFDHIRPDAPESLKLANLFINEMRQDIYEPALLAAAAIPQPALTIYKDPVEFGPCTPVRFSLRFDRYILNDASAIQEWTCRWEFGDGSLQETGWEVYHVFAHSGEYTVLVTLTNLEGGSVLPAPITATISAGLTRAAWYEKVAKAIRPHAETLLEASRLAMVLSLAIFGLVASAQKQAQSLSLIEATGAVFALGFGADTLKNLMTQRADK